MRTPRQSLRTALCASAIVLVGALLVWTGICRRGIVRRARATVRDQPRPPRRVAISRPRKERPERALKASLILRKAMTAKLTKAVRPITANRRRMPAPRSKPEKIPAMPTCTSSRCVVWTKRKASPAGTTRRFRISKASARRLSPVPQAPNPVRNAIGVVVPAPAHVELHDAAHPPPVAPRAPAATPVVPNTTAPLGKPGMTNHPIANPVITPPVANRGAINGTGVTQP